MFEIIPAEFIHPPNECVKRPAKRRSVVKSSFVGWIFGTRLERLFPMCSPSVDRNMGKLVDRCSICVIPEELASLGVKPDFTFGDEMLAVLFE